MIPRYATGLLALCCLAITSLAGCARSPAVTFYTLSPVGQPETATPAMVTQTVAVASVTLPELVDRPQMVVRADESRVDVLETHRWAEPLKSGIPRLLAENLSRLLGGARVSAYPQNAAHEADFRVFVDFQRFESTGDAVVIDALWTIRRSIEGAPKTGRMQIREPNSGGGYEAMVSAYNKALFAVSKDIAQAIRTDLGGTR